MLNRAFGAAAVIGWSSVIATAVVLAEPRAPGGGTDHTWLWLILLSCVVLGISGSVGFLTTREAALEGQDGPEMRDVRGDAAQTSGDSSPIVQGNPNVVSINQSGGITAGNVSIGRQPRTLGPAVSVEIVERLRVYSGTKFMFVPESQAWDSHNFAAEIQQLLEAAGWVASGGGFIQQFPPVRGLHVYSPEALDGACAEFQSCMSDLGFPLARSARKRLSGMGPIGRPGTEAPPEPELIEITIGM